MRVSDLVSGAIFALAGTAIAVTAYGYPSAAQGTGPGLFPMIIGGGLALAGLTTMVGVLLRVEAMPLTTPEDWMRDRAKIAAVAAIPVGIAAFPLIAPVIGTLIVSTVIVMGLSLAWGERPFTAAIVGVVSSAVLFGLFSFGLRVPLPSGALEQLIR
jgi:putative tricarboxylic transport membrane protein